MNKTVNEKILDFINEAEKREARKVKYKSESRSEIIKSNEGGIEVNSDKKIILNAEDDIEIKGVSIEGEFHIKGNNVMKNGSSRESYAPFAQGGI